MYGQQVAHATTYSPEIPGPILALANFLDCENPAKHRDSHWFVVRWRAMDFERGFVPRPRYFLLRRQKKVSKEKATRDTRPAGSLCFSKSAAAAELAACSRSNSPRRLPRSFLRCSALLTGARPWRRKRSLLMAGDDFCRSDFSPNFLICLGCKPLWYCAVASPASQCQSGLQGRCLCRLGEGVPE